MTSKTSKTSELLISQTITSSDMRSKAYRIRPIDKATAARATAEVIRGKTRELINHCRQFIDSEQLDTYGQMNPDAEQLVTTLLQLVDAAFILAKDVKMAAQLGRDFRMSAEGTALQIAATGARVVVGATGVIFSTFAYPDDQEQAWRIQTCVESICNSPVPEFLGADAQELAHYDRQVDRLFDGMDEKATAAARQAISAAYAASARKEREA